MTISELEERLKKHDMLQVYAYGAMKRYIPPWEGKWENITDAFGIRRVRFGRYQFYITDSERGIPRYSASFPTEARACGALMRKMSLFKTIQEREGI